MRNWEDILKNKLERYEKPLQEGSLARFQALRNAESNLQGFKRFPFTWVIGAAVAVLAIVLLIRQPSKPDMGIQFARQPEQTVAFLPDTVDTYEPEQEPALIAQADISAGIERKNASQHDNPIIREDKCTNDGDRTLEPVEIIATETAAESISETAEEEAVETAAVTDDELNEIAQYSFVPDLPDIKQLDLEVSYAAAGVASNGAAAALAEVGLFALSHRDYSPRENGREYQQHYPPLKTGLSLRFPVSNNLSITSGINYLLYLSQFYYYYIDSKNMQIVHYLGIPLRLDGTLASNRWFDVYVGGGIEADFYLHGKEIEEEWGPYGGLELSLVTVGGIQYNFTKNLGVYIEPELSWIMHNRGPYTFRDMHPLSFSVSTGIRISFNR